ncbi:MAG: L-serine ammonia-lyase, iron-sulfur-dependent, subunit alpha [Desulfotomaculum sp.]|nr:L-serine ammonia-lyase, iron-sulfur-dependent, subunit alpha [Desulfotomaculum sp.]MCL0081246.1 L-serine ammonia-lyase, iron-sulfur-dependent, subunit alpha [Peptococcaceae bacterium]
MLFTTIAQLVDLAETNKKKISDIMLEQELAANKSDQDALLYRMATHLKIMQQAVERGLTENLKSRSGLAGGEARLLATYNQKNTALAGNLITTALTMAIATTEVNACMGAIVAAPTAGACGVIPGCIFAVGDHLESTEEDLIAALFTAGAIGLVIANNASISGAEGGCQAEIGSAAGMAAAAVTQLSGGSPRQCADAVAIALKSMLGLVCDPVAGLVEVPCIKRNATATATAITSADMALAGLESIIPCDEVIEAMNRIGCSMPVALRETSMGGLATTKTGKQIAERVFGKPSPESDCASCSH